MSKEWNAEMAKTIDWIEENEQAKELFVKLQGAIEILTSMQEEEPKKEKKK